MTQFGAPLHEDVNGLKTSAEWDGSQWVYKMTGSGDIATGETSDAAVTDPTSAGSIISLLKGLLTFLRISATGLGKAEDTPHVTGDTGVMGLAVRRDAGAALATADGDYTPLQTDNLGRLRVVTTLADRVGLLLNARTTALAERQLVKASAGTLFGFQGYTTLDGFVQVHADADGTLSGGAQALEVIKVTAPSGGLGGPFSLDFGQYGLAVTTGITIAFSTTGPTYTAGGANMFVSAQYQ